jgi:hypothetical protein
MKYLQIPEVRVMAVRTGAPRVSGLAMTLIDTPRRLGRAERKVLRLQRRLWFAQLAIWPTVIVLAVLLVGGVLWVVRRRSGGGRHATPPAANGPAGEYTP